MTKEMKILIAYDGSGHADAAIASLSSAGLSVKAEVKVISVADAFLLPAISGIR